MIHHLVPGNVVQLYDCNVLIWALKSVAVAISDLGD